MKMNRFGLNLHSVFLDPEFGHDKAENYPSATETPETKAQMDRAEQVQQVVDAEKENENALADTVVQTPDFSNIAGHVASEVSTQYTDMEQLKSDRTRFTKRVQAVDGSGKKYGEVWKEKMEDGYKKLVNQLKTEHYFDGFDEATKLEKAKEVATKYFKEASVQYKAYIWDANDAQFNAIKDKIFSADEENSPFKNTYKELTGLGVNRDRVEGYDSEVLIDEDADPTESMSDRQNRQFLSKKLPEYLWDLRHTPGIVKLLKRVPGFSAKIDQPSKADQKAISNFIKAASKINAPEGKDKAVALFEAFQYNGIEKGDKESYKTALNRVGITVEEKYMKDIMKAGDFYVDTQNSGNGPREQHAIYLGVLEIIKTEGGVDAAAKKFKPIVEANKDDRKTEKKEGYATGEKLKEVDSGLYNLATKLGISDFTSATRLSQLNPDYFKNTPAEKILANLNNDRTLDARDALAGGSKSGKQFLEIFNQVGKEKALSNLLEHAKLLNKTLGLGLDETKFTGERIKEGDYNLILLLQNIINKPGEDLYTLLTGRIETSGDPFEGIDFVAEKGAADKKAQEIIGRMNREALQQDGLILPTPEEMQSGLAATLYTEYTRGIGLGSKISFNEWAKGLEMNTGFQVRDNGSVVVGIGLDYSKKFDLGKGWSTTPELAAGAFIPLGISDPKLTGSIGASNEIAKEWITKKGVEQHLGLNGSATLMPMGVTILSVGANWSRDKLAGIETAEQKKKVEFRDSIMSPILENLLAKREGIKNPDARKLNFNDESLVNDLRASILEVAKTKDIPEDKQEMVTNAVIRLLINYNGANLSDKGIRDAIAQGVAEQYAMARAEDRKAHISDKTYLSGASLGAFWVAGSPLVGIYAGLKWTTHHADGYGDRFGRSQEIAQEYQGEWNQELLDKFNQQLGLKEKLTIENNLIKIPSSIAGMVLVNRKMQLLMKKDEKGNVFLDTHTPMSVDIRRGAATGNTKMVIGGKEGGENDFVHLDVAIKKDEEGYRWFIDPDKTIDQGRVLELGGGLKEYNLDVLNKAIDELNKKLQGTPINHLVPDAPTADLLIKLNEINKNNKKAKLTVLNNNGRIEFQPPVEGENGRGLELEYQANFEMIDSNAKKIAEKVYEQVLKLDANGVRVLNSVKHDVGGKKHWDIYDTFNKAILDGKYTEAKSAIKPVFDRLIKDCKLNANDNGFKTALETLDQIKDDAALGQALMSIDNIFARSTRVVGSNGEYTFPREGAEGMSNIIKSRETGISKTIERYFENDVPTRDAYLALINASKAYREANLSKFRVKSTKAEQLKNTVGFNLGDKTNPERPLFNPEIYQQMMDLNSQEFQTEALKNAKNTIHKRAMEQFAENKALITPVLKMLGLEGKTVKVNKESRKLNEQNQNKGQITLDIGEGNDIKKVTLSTGMKFGYFTQCVNHTVILDDITIIGEDGTTVNFNSGVWENGTYREGNRSTIVSTTEVGVSGSVIVHNEKPTQPDNPDSTPTEIIVPEEPDNPDSTPTEIIVPPEGPTTNPGHHEYDGPGGNPPEANTPTPTPTVATGGYGGGGSGGGRD